jgi:hypothetical protein
MVDPWHTGPLVPVLARRRDALVASLGGSDGVLVLAGPPAVRPADAPDQVAHLVTIGWLAAAPDLDRAVGEVLERLAPDGWLHVVEPTSGRPVLARSQRLTSPVAQRRTGWHLGRDIPGALRAAGLAVTDVERFDMPVSNTLLQPWVQARARRRAAFGSLAGEQAS